MNGRPIATIGSKTPNFEGTFWEVLLDTATHLILPTLAIMLISFAGYSRYSRASMLEVLNADYVRTARAKGLTERTVVLRHAFRNAMIPIATLAALDFGAVIAGAIITETVFGWKGMGVLFTSAVDTRGRLPDHGSLHRDRDGGGGLQPDRRHQLRRSRPEDPAVMTRSHQSRREECGHERHVS